MFGGSSANAYMLIYRQRKLNVVQKPKVPDYWSAAVGAQNEANVAERAHYQELKNQFDIVIQPSVLFAIDSETNFVRYIDDENIDKQGVTVRCKFTDSVAQIADQVREKLAISGEFKMVEVQRL